MEILDNDFINDENKLSEEDMELVPIIAQGLSAHIGKENKIKSEDIVSTLYKRTGIELTEIKLKSIIRYIRHNDIVSCVVSSGGGYWVANSLEECLSTIRTFEKRRYAEYYTELKLIEQTQNRYDVDIKLIHITEAKKDENYNTVFVEEKSNPENPNPQSPL